MCVTSSTWQVSGLFMQTVEHEAVVMVMGTEFVVACMRVVVML
jgi:hypothetical protein